MALRPFATGLLGLALTACSGPNQERPGAPPVLPGSGVEAPIPVPAKVLLKQVARSIWGVVPEAPRYKKNLRPELIRGSAVAVAPDTLLASCRVVGQREQVGVVRHNKYRLAQV